MYMITMVTEDRRPLFGEVAGRSEAVEPSPDAPHIVLTSLGEAVAQAWQSISTYHPEVEVVALQMMPDHLHGILFVKEKMEKPLGKVLLGFKQGCNKAFRELMPAEYAHQVEHSHQVEHTHQVEYAHQVEYVAVLQQQTEQQPPKATDGKHGLLFAKGYNDRILFRQGQLERWLHYLKDNPRRLLMKRENPALFRIQR